MSLLPAKMMAQIESIADEYQKIVPLLVEIRDLLAEQLQLLARQDVDRARSAAMKSVKG